jgi:hypothetical protein
VKKDDAFYKEVASEYETLFVKVKDPGRTLARQRGVPETRVANWIHEARRRGLLAPSLRSKGWFRRFVLHRYEDETGLSGTGIVAHGCVFPNGKLALAWWAPKNQIASVTVYDSLRHVEKLHGHNGKTRIEWRDS